MTARGDARKRQAEDAAASPISMHSDAHNGLTEAERETLRVTAAPDVSERDELARVIARELGCTRKGEIGGHSMCGEHHYGWLSTGECPVQERITDAILSAGWRRR